MQEQDAVDERQFREDFEALAPRTWATYALIAVNVIVWGLMVLSGVDPFHPTSAMVLRWGGNTAFNVQHGEWWRLLTATFLHSGVEHLMVNMIGLWLVGQTAERIYGHRLFLLVYIGAALVGSAFSLHVAALRGVSVGASGAVFGIAGALLVAVYEHRATLPKVFSKEMFTGIGFFLVYSLVQGFAKPGVDNAAHVGGLLAGVVMAMVLPVRFNILRFAAQVRSRAVVAAALAVCLAMALALTAPTARVDLQRTLVRDHAR